MIVFESRKQRRALLRLERGEELVASLRKWAEEQKVKAAWVRGVGALEWAVLDRHDQARRAPEPPQRFDTPCELLTLEGHVSLEDGAPTPMLHATLARRTDNGVDLLGGRVVRAGVFGVELMIDVLADVRLERVEDEATGLAVWTGPSRPGAEAHRAAPTRAWVEPASEAPDDEGDEHDRDEPDDEDGGEAPAASSGGVSWADVAAVSASPEVDAPPKRRQKGRAKRARGAQPPTPAFEPPPMPSTADEPDDVYDDEPTPEKGDFIQHRQFGQCKVDREDGRGGLVIKLPSGVRKTIKLDYMEVGQPRMEGRKRVFPIRPRKKR
ncbi:MAG TPA: DNA-binding protein [Sandaracinaceae bacterium LLY-WYZ-13_1]|nr:DNA-binding protein [Sandaracinaceae bacterium LLY-WYZ-13_1]